MLFPYEGQNEDELSLKEGEIINIVTKVNPCGGVFSFLCMPIPTQCFFVYLGNHCFEFYVIWLARFVCKGKKNLHPGAH